MIRDAFAAVKKLLLLEERVRALATRVERQDAQLLDYRDRLVRLEVYVSILRGETTVPTALTRALAPPEPDTDEEA